MMALCVHAANLIKRGCSKLPHVASLKDLRPANAICCFVVSLFRCCWSSALMRVDDDSVFRIPQRADASSVREISNSKFQTPNQQTGSRCAWRSWQQMRCTNHRNNTYRHTFLAFQLPLLPTERSRQTHNRLFLLFIRRSFLFVHEQQSLTA